MSRMIFRRSVLLAAVSLWCCLAIAEGLPAQSNNQSAVTIKVTPKNLQAAVWEFDVVFDTHSQELKDDLLKTAVLIAADGTQVSPVNWQGDPPAGHHRKGVLRFNALKPAPAKIALRISRPGETKPRNFEWELK
jgi:hypothetical protein